MNIAFTPEHEELRQVVRRFMEKESTEPVVRALMESERGYESRTWERMAAELSLPGLIIPEKHGGAGLGAVELAIVMEEMGRVLFCAPFLSTAVLATSALIRIADEATQAELLPTIASGGTIAALAFAEAGGRFEADVVKTAARNDDSGFRLEGEKAWVVDGQVADVLLVTARDADGLALFRVAADAPGLEREALPALDLTRKLARVTFSGAPATRISKGDVASAIRQVLALGVTALAAEQVGGARRCLDMAVEYAKTRLQFGRAIGSFQAIKHKCADMLVETELARSAAYNAAFVLAAGESDDDVLVAAHMAKSYCSETYFHAAAENIQIHGGMGFTWEHAAHLYFKRARASSVLFGDAIDHRHKLAGRIGL